MSPGPTEQRQENWTKNWTTLRSTCERLKPEGLLCAGHAGPYLTAPNPEAMPAERFESLVSQQQAAWGVQREEAAGGGGDRQ